MAAARRGSGGTDVAGRRTRGTGKARRFPADDSDMDPKPAAEADERRTFIRHPTGVPLEVVRDDSRSVAHTLSNVCYGGIAFHCDQALRPGERLRLRIPVLQPAFEADGKVVWCERQGEGFEAGIVFLSAEEAFRARMVEQVCHIEEYRRRVRLREGRHIDSRQAALEWIEKYAGRFPEP